MMRRLIPLMLLGVVLFTVASCKKIQEDMLVNGLWRMDKVVVNDTSSNIMNYTLQHFSNGNGCCEYKMYFEPDGVVFAYYNTYDTSNTFAQGTWELEEYNKLYINMDKYFDGYFKVVRKAAKKYEFSSEANHFRVFDGVRSDIDTAACIMTMQRL